MGGNGRGPFLSSFMRAHAQAMNEYREGAMSTEVVVRRRKLWTVDGSEGVLTIPPWVHPFFPCI